MPGTALLVIDMLNPYDHEDADPLAEAARGRVPVIADLVERARDDADTLTVYVNDNEDRWEADRRDVIARALDGKHPELVEPIVPHERVPFILKGRHSIFYETALHHLLRINDVKRVVMAGQVTEQCILYSALDAYIRGYEIEVPREGVVPIDERLGDAALQMMERNMHADIV
jgi:nicotinamidase-related amidase